MCNSDPFWAANLLIQTYGREAAHEALLQAVKMRISRDKGGESLWLNVLEAVIDLQMDALEYHELVATNILK